MSDDATRRRLFILGCGIDCLGFDETVTEIDRLVNAGRRTQHCSVNAAKIVLLNKDERLRAIINGCALVSADGQAVVWASRILGRPLPERVAGIDLFCALLHLAAARGYRVFFLGATRATVEATAARARREYPGLVVSGARDGYWGSDDGDVVAAIRVAAPHLLFVALPSPRKEYWLADRLDLLGVSFAMGVGGSFDVYAGLTRRAPLWMQRAGLEWAFRLAQEPSRMWRRYLLGNLEFLRLVLEYRLGRARLQAPPDARGERGP